MFLFNMFSRSDISSEDDRYDKITFEINISENIPQYQYIETQPLPEQQFNPSHPLYYQLFPRKEIIFKEYTVTENDTVSGLAFKLQVSEQSIRTLNTLSGDIYAGMVYNEQYRCIMDDIGLSRWMQVIKLPDSADLSKLQIQTKESSWQTSELVADSFEASIKYKVSYYVGGGGYVKGIITINPNYIIFNPSLQNQANISRFTIERLLKFNAIVETHDVQDIVSMEIPQMTAETEQPLKLSVIQFMLYKVGNAKIQKKFKERLTELRKMHKPIASVSFIVDEDDKDRTSAFDIADRVHKILKDTEDINQLQRQKQGARLTSIPFFDIIHANIQQITPTQKQLQPSRQSLSLGTFSQQSTVMSKQQFSALAVHLPMLYQLQNWVSVYRLTRDGSSFVTFLSKCKNVEPALMLVKEYNGYKFGAFLIESIETGKTGRGEMFIFSFKEQLQVYRWTLKNKAFVFVQKEGGIGIGMGFKHALFLKSTLDKGYSASSYTFGNEHMLSKKEEFAVEELEVWGLDTRFE